MNKFIIILTILISFTNCKILKDEIILIDQENRDSLSTYLPAEKILIIHDSLNNKFYIADRIISTDSIKGVLRRVTIQDHPEPIKKIHTPKKFMLAHKIIHIYTNESFINDSLNISIEEVFKIKIHKKNRKKSTLVNTSIPLSILLVGGAITAIVLTR